MKITKSTRLSKWKKFATFDSKEQATQYFEDRLAIDTEEAQDLLQQLIDYNVITITHRRPKKSPNNDKALAHALMKRSPELSLAQAYAAIQHSRKSAPPPKEEDPEKSMVAHIARALVRSRKQRETFSENLKTR